MVKIINLFIILAFFAGSYLLADSKKLSLKEQRNLAEIKNKEGLALHKKKKYAEAISKWEEAAKINYWWKPYFNIACANSIQNKLDEVEEYLYKAHAYLLEESLDKDEAEKYYTYIYTDPDLNNFRKSDKAKLFYKIMNNIIKSQKPQVLDFNLSGLECYEPEYSGPEYDYKNYLFKAGFAVMSASSYSFKKNGSFRESMAAGYSSEGSYKIEQNSSTISIDATIDYGMGSKPEAISKKMKIKYYDGNIICFDKYCYCIY